MRKQTHKSPTVGGKLVHGSVSESRVPAVRHGRLRVSLIALVLLVLSCALVLSASRSLGRGFDGQVVHKVQNSGLIDNHSLYLLDILPDIQKDTDANPGHGSGVSSDPADRGSGNLPAEPEPGQATAMPITGTGAPESATPATHERTFADFDHLRALARARIVGVSALVYANAPLGVRIRKEVNSPWIYVDSTPHLDQGVHWLLFGIGGVIVACILAWRSGGIGIGR